MERQRRPWRMRPRRELRPSCASAATARWVPALLWLLASPAWAVAGSGADATRTVAEAGSPAERPQVRELEPRTLLQLVLLHNSDVLFARAQARIAGEGVAAEGALYEPVAYASLKRDGRDRQRTVEERLTAALGGLTRLDENGKAAETGVRVRTPSGGEASMAWRAGVRTSNVIRSAPFAQGDREGTGAFVLTLRQPLLRGLGRGITETDRRVAEAEAAIGRWQLRQQVLRVASDALAAYWQLQRAAESQQWRREAAEAAERLQADTRLRIAGGRLPPAAQEEAEANLAARQAELARGRLTLAEAEARVRVLLDLPATDSGWRTQPPREEAVEARPMPAGAGDRLGDRLGERLGERLTAALAQWPALRIAELKRDQALDRLDFARNRTLPGLDAQLSYSSNALSTSGWQALQDAPRGRNPDWSVALQLEVPLGGDKRASAQARAQALRVEQSRLEIHAVRQALASDLINRAAQLDAARAELALWRRDLDARQALLAAERAQYDNGSSTLARLLRRQTELLDARQRHGEALTRVELARVALQLADGTLLDHHDVRIDDEL
jgi:outer membrane protein TolC